MLGTAGVIVLAEPTCIVRALLRYARFYAHESCGQCTPCREGTGWVVKILETIESGAGQPEHIDLLLDVANSYEGTTICALADAAAWPIQGVLKKYLPEVKAHIELGRCPYDGRKHHAGEDWPEKAEQWLDDAAAVPVLRGAEQAPKALVPPPIPPPGRPAPPKKSELAAKLGLRKASKEEEA